MARRRSWRRTFRGALALAGVVCALPVAGHASITLLLEQPYGKLNLVDPGGHSAIYLDHICAASPTKLRPCEPGELGVVISRYDGIGAHDWLAMPLVPYLYAVDSVNEIPHTMSKLEVPKVRDAYRRAHLESVAPSLPNGDAPNSGEFSNWYELVGASFDRTIYGFRVVTTQEQDEMLLAVFNDQKNDTERYNGIYRNCADFVRVAIDRVYPHAIRRNWIADLGVTSPKMAARGLAHYAAKHPEAKLDVFVIPQVAGDLPRSHGNTGVLEGVLKRYSLPLVLLSPHIEGVVLVSYVVHGRFSVPKNAPELDLTQMEAESMASKPFPVTMPPLPEAVATKVTPTAVAVTGRGSATVGTSPVMSK
jgi:hypothetical protein